MQEQNCRLVNNVIGSMRLAYQQADVVAQLKNRKLVVASIPEITVAAPTCPLEAVCGASSLFTSSLFHNDCGLPVVEVVCG